MYSNSTTENSCTEYAARTKKKKNHYYTDDVVNKILYFCINRITCTIYVIVLCTYIHITSGIRDR